MVRYTSLIGLSIAHADGVGVGVGGQGSGVRGWEGEAWDLYFISPFTLLLSPFTFRLSPVTCHLSPVTLPYFPFQLGLRFSAKAFGPSLTSSEYIICCSAGYERESARSKGKPRPIIAHCLL